MGEGQEVVALEKMKQGFLAGTWVILQNCHLGLSFMGECQEWVASLRALPGLGNVWSSFTACENYAEGWFNDDVSCNALGLVRVAQAEAVRRDLAQPSCFLVQWRQRALLLGPTALAV